MSYMCSTARTKAKSVRNDAIHLRHMARPWHTPSQSPLPLRARLQNVVPPPRARFLEEAVSLLALVSCVLSMLFLCPRVPPAHMGVWEHSLLLLHLGPETARRQTSGVRELRERLGPLPIMSRMFYNISSCVKQM